jgi:polyribonucleotide nucleotidyltransferase
MDFKVAGSADGITALQMDIKVGGITMDIMRKALEQARAGRMHILEKMQQTLSVARDNVSAHAPRIVTIRIPVDKIRDVIGPGGKMIRSIIERTGVKIDVEDDGRVNVASADEASAQKAIGIIQELTATPELNKSYMGKVQRITDFGAFVEIMPGLDGLLHVSEIAHYRVKDVRDELKEGEQVLVKVINIDPSGKIRLSRKVLIDPPEGGVPPAGDGGSREGGERPRREGGRPDGGRGGFRGDRDRDRGGDRGPRGGHDRRHDSGPGGNERRPDADTPRTVPTEVPAARGEEPGGDKE